MGGLTSSLQIGTFASALLWPLAAGVAVVLWSKGRAAARARRIAETDGQLRSLYRSVEMKPLPPHLTMVVDALQEGEELAPGPGAKGKTDAGASAGS